MVNRMLVEVWSDIACPFCWLGKHRFANALARFEHRDDVEVRWKSFQLSPALRTDPTVRIDEFLSRSKGIDRAVARQMNERVAEAGRREGLAYEFGRIVVANTFDAHRLVHIAGEHGRQDAMMDRLFRAYFSEGRNIDDRETLAALATDVGLDAASVAAALASGEHRDAVRSDIAEARALGISGVPFFALDRKYGVSGAQDAEVFLEALGQSHREWKEEVRESGAAAEARGA